MASTTAKTTARYGSEGHSQRLFGRAHSSRRQPLALHERARHRVLRSSPRRPSGARARLLRHQVLSTSLHLLEFLAQFRAGHADGLATGNGSEEGEPNAVHLGRIVVPAAAGHHPLCAIGLAAMGGRGIAVAGCGVGEFQGEGSASAASSVAEPFSLAIKLLYAVCGFDAFSPDTTQGRILLVEEIGPVFAHPIAQFDVAHCELPFASRRRLPAFRMIWIAASSSPVWHQSKAAMITGSILASSQ